MHMEYEWPMAFVYLFVYNPSRGCVWEHWVVRPDVFSKVFRIFSFSIQKIVEVIQWILTWKQSDFFPSLQHIPKAAFLVLTLGLSLSSYHRRALQCSHLYFGFPKFHILLSASPLFSVSPDALLLFSWFASLLPVLVRFGFLFSLSISFLFSLGSQYFILVVSSKVHALFLPLLRFSCSFLLFLFSNASSFLWFSISFCLSEM